MNQLSAPRVLEPWETVRATVRFRRSLWRAVRIGTMLAVLASATWYAAVSGAIYFL